MTDFTNDQLHASSFLQGHNAEYVEQLYAQYVANPASVDADWAEFFAALGDDIGDVTGAAAGPSWSRPDWPPQPNDELTSALDGQWADDPQKAGDKIKANAKSKGAVMSNDDVQQAVLDSMRALMIILAPNLRASSFIRRIASRRPRSKRDS